MNNLFISATKNFYNYISSTHCKDFKQQWKDFYKNKCDLVVANDLETIRNGNHNAYIIDRSNSIEEAQGKDDIAKKLIRRINYGK